MNGTFAVPTAGVNVASGGFNDYTFTFNSSGGSQTVRVEYDNDYNGPFGDRNLIVDWVEVGCP